MPHEDKMRILAEITRLRQICCDPSLIFENYHGTSAKRAACLDLIQSAIDGGHRMLVFSQFTSMLDLLAADLKKEAIPFFTITGATPKQERLRLVNEFNAGDTPVFLISLKAGGTGLNLTGADVVIHYDPWWNLAVQNQATDRAHRIGQTRQVTVMKLIAAESIEEKIVELQEAKRELADAIIGGQTNSLMSLSREELLALIE
jgi:SNF2 family DNA or RNA helicase